MRQGGDQCYLESDDYKAYKEIEEQIGLCTPEQAWAMYYVSTGMVRENITLAVMEHIGRGIAPCCLNSPTWYGSGAETMSPEHSRPTGLCCAGIVDNSCAVDCGSAASRAAADNNDVKVTHRGVARVPRPGG